MCNKLLYCNGLMTEAPVAQLDRASVYGTEVGFHDHPDPDSRWENVSWYMPRSEFPGRIKQALEAGFPVIVSIRNHGVLLYGADYDSNGSPIIYYIKDSYPDYYYLADADYLHEISWEMTTVKL